MFRGREGQSFSKVVFKLDPSYFVNFSRNVWRKCLAFILSRGREGQSFSIVVFKLDPSYFVNFSRHLLFILIPAAYSELCHTPKMVLSAKIVTEFQISALRVQRVN